MTRTIQKSISSRMSFPQCKKVHVHDVAVCVFIFEGLIDSDVMMGSGADELFEKLVLSLNGNLCVLSVPLFCYFTIFYSHVPYYEMNFYGSLSNVLCKCKWIFIWLTARRHPVEVQSLHHSLRKRGQANKAFKIEITFSRTKTMVL